MNTDSQTLPARLTNLTAADVYSNPEALEDILTEIEQAARSIAPPDITTKAGREAVSSLAYKVARSKTFLDEKLGKPLVADWKAKAKAVDALRKLARDRLDALKAEVRQPLTDYEQAEADRQAQIIGLLEAWHGQQRATQQLDPAIDPCRVISAEITRIEALPIVPELEERQSEAQQIKDATLYQLHQKLERAKQVEAERARIAEEEEAKRQAEREAHERQIAEQAAAAAKQEAEEQARQALERERQQAEQKANAQIEALQRQEREAETARWEADRYERRAAEAKAQAERDAEAAQRKRQRLATKAERADNALPDREEQARIHREVLADLCDFGIHEATARALITAIARGGISHLTITY
ncbi:MAG: hypothetical protein GVY22_18470 [Gammaproteobacteria bacterium]|nr:hypothetical protein [Gammaproteobacteria bacterium]